MRKSLSLVLSAAVALGVTASAAGVAGQQAPKRLISQDRPSMEKVGTKQALTAKVNGATAISVSPMEKPRVFDPFGHPGFDPAGKIILTL